MSETILDQVHRAQTLGIKVIVVGAGVGGLLTALECWRKGCEVVILERAAAISPLGDFFTIPPSGLTTLRHYPSMHADYHQSVFDCSISIYRSNGHCVKTTMPEWVRFPAGSAAPDVKVSFIKQRPVFTKMLYDQCLRLGIPIHFSQTANSFTEHDDLVVIETDDGTKFTGDICVAADGIGTKFTRSLEVSRAPVLDSGYSVARAAFPRDTIKAGSPAETLLKNVKDQPEFRTILGEDLHLILFLTSDHVAFAYTHESDGDAAESWHNLRHPQIFIDQLEKKAPDWDPAVLDFLRQVPVKVVDWGLRWRDPVQKWTSDHGRVIAVGDAAHAFLPTSGNGAVQASEDAISLAECLRIGGKQGVTWSTKVHNKLRFERVTVLQQAGFINREELHHADLEAIEKESSANEVGFFKQGRWVWEHDAEKYAAENYTACLETLQNGESFVNTNLPPGHEFKVWSMQQEIERMAKKIPSDLKSNGYWGV